MKITVDTRHDSMKSALNAVRHAFGDAPSVQRTENGKTSKKNKKPKKTKQANATGQKTEASGEPARASDVASTPTSADDGHAWTREGPVTWGNAETG